MNQQKALTGSAFHQFIAVSTLLSLLDPVRGKPTVHSLDKHPHDSAGRHDYLLTRFLDSFALICSTARKGGETASAVCLERDPASGTILRLSRNRGVPRDLINRLQPVLQKLTTIALKGHPMPELEDRILYDVIEIDKDKIKSLLERLCAERVRQDVGRAMLAMKDRIAYQEEYKSSSFSHWISSLPSLLSLAVDAGPVTLLPHIKWASRARWAYSKQLTSFLSSSQADMPQWVNIIYKLGRYYAATQAMVKLASKQPELFRSIRIEPVECPTSEAFLLKDKNALTSLLTRLGRKDDVDDLVSKLGRFWFMDDPEGFLRKNPEAYFRKKCNHTLTVHAEMQLLAFYDSRPELSLRLLFMGTSKKACYLCEKFLLQHRLKMIVSAGHQKIWPSWMPPPSSSQLLQQTYRKILLDMKRDLEKTAARELEGELGRRRPPNLDSTAGPPISFTSKSSTAPMTLERGTL
ncbi:hypothetical protein S7711_03912 [Stachybotrys chartarum IBT 7711]|uniref:Uncharacterized protein n=1 Tax=Stachybotrys chartarum (strain CBS 109288 / IBT 7711) TaxID=1280523 RepID=A0A084AHZ3_STACB|nr:hypothetical protein S7711_03912 [Stachybotrys chartarum IBT 7711]KFA51310.1 hypothetical protein S40293_04397 [Stachybotrys chartarum IBT 40293]